MVSQLDIDTLNAAIAAGTRQVTIGGQSILYQTTDSLIKARNDLQAQLDNQTPDRVRRRKQTYLYQSGRGYE